MQSTARLILTALFCFAMDAVAPVTALAQGGGATTSLSGTVTDTSGAIIPGATVVIKSVATATQFDTVTNESGYSSVPALDPGVYTVTVTLMGFKTAVLNDVRINASTPATGKVALAVGGLEETVVVTGGAEIIQTTSAAVTSTIDTNQISRSRRQPQRAGVCRPAAGRQHARRSRRIARLDGERPAAERHQHHHRRHERAGQPPEDGRRLLRARQPASRRHRRGDGQLGGAGRASTGQGAVQIRFITRSGSNQFTGSGYYYLQHDNLNANTWFNNRDNAPKADDIPHQPGGRIGGPIMIPGSQRPQQGVLLLQLRRVALAGCEHREPHDPASARGAGLVPLHRRRRHPRGERALAGRDQRIRVDDRSDDRTAPRRYPRLDGRQHGRRQHRPADAELHLLVPNRQRHQVPDRARWTSTSPTSTACRGR